MSIKYRIKEISGGGHRPIFYPQYKSFLFWHNIKNHTGFYFSSYNKNKGDTDIDIMYYYDFSEARDIIEEFKKYKANEDVYIEIYNID